MYLGQLPPGGVEDAPCTYWDIITGKCDPSQMPGGAPTLPSDCAAQGMEFDWTTGQCKPPAGPYPPGYTPPLPDPPSWPPEPPPLPGGAPVITETECQAREVQAHAEGKAAMQSDIIKTAAVSAAVSAIVGGVIGYMLR